MNVHDARRLATGLIDEHLADTGEGWHVSFDNAKRRFGQTRYRQHEISLSAPLVQLNEEQTVRDVILHEIAHAIAGSEAGHGPAWKRAALAVGARPERCYDGNTVVTVPRAWKGECPNGHVVERYKLTATTRKSACSQCCKQLNGGRFSNALLFTWSRGGEHAQAH